MTTRTLTPVVPGVSAITQDSSLAVVSNVRAYPLDHVHPNPYQTRLAEDHAHVQALADDIATHTMLQVPLARPYPGKPGHIQLAFGHSRFAAYKLLADPIVMVDDKERFFYFPADVRELTDRQMSDLAAAENAKRKNLSAIEVATAIQKRIKDFKLNQLDAGAPFGYTHQSSVANLLSLLKLPDTLQASVSTGEVPERIARQAVRVSQLFPEETTARLKKAAQAPAHQREEAMLDALAQVLDRKGRNINQAVFSPEWPEQPIALNGQSIGELTELRACHGCPFFYKRDDDRYCLLPDCYDLKNERAMEAQLVGLSKKLSVPVLAEGERGVELFNQFHYTEGDLARQLLKRFKKDAGLRLAPTVDRKHSYAWRDVTGSPFVRLVTVDKPACDLALKTLARSGNDKPAAHTGSTVIDSATLESEREERRQQKAIKLRVEHDVVWIVQNATAIIAGQLTISGQILAYVVARLLRSNRSQASQFYGLLDWYDAMEKKAETATGKDADTLRRQLLVAAEIFEHGLGWNMLANDDCWEGVTEHLKDLATSGAETDRDGEPGFGVKLPTGWNKPPIHKTEYNCWHCGVFASNRRLSKRDIEAGWVPTEKSGKVVDVHCPDCAPKATKKGK